MENCPSVSNTASIVGKFIYTVGDSIPLLGDKVRSEIHRVFPDPPALSMLNADLHWSLLFNLSEEVWSSYAEAG